MILSPIRLVRCALIKREIDRNCAERKRVRLNGQTYVRSYTRRRVS